MKKSKPRGFSLVEIVLAISMLGLGILVVLGIFPKIIDLNLSRNNNVKAIQLVQDKMDELLAAGTQVTGAYDQPTSVIPNSRRTWIGSAPVSHLQQVTLTVDWPERGRQRSFSTTSLLFIP